MSRPAGSSRCSAAVTAIRWPAVGSRSRSSSTAGKSLRPGTRSSSTARRPASAPCTCGTGTSVAASAAEHRGVARRPSAPTRVTEEEQLLAVAVAVDVDRPRHAARAGEVSRRPDDPPPGDVGDPLLELDRQPSVGHQKNDVRVVFAAATSASLVTTTVGLLSMSMNVWRSAQWARPASVPS